MTIHNFDLTTERQADFGEDTETTLEFVVIHDATDGLFAIKTDQRCPRRYDLHPDPAFAGARVDSISVVAADDSETLSYVSVRYSTELDEQDNPLERPAEITMAASRETRPAFVDGEGEANLNTAGDPVVGFERSDTTWIFHVSKNVNKLPRVLLDYNDTLNSDAVKLRGLTCKPGTVSVRDLRVGDWENENDVEFFVFSFDLHYRRGGWIEERLNQGYNELVERSVPLAVPRLLPDDTWQTTTTALVKERIFLDSGEPPAEPQLLDADGQRPRHTEGDLKGQVKQILDPSDIVFLRRELDPRKPFNVLPLK